MFYDAKVILFVFALAVAAGIFWAARMIYIVYFKDKINIKALNIKALKGNFMKTVTFKGIAVVILTLVLLIPSALIRNLIEERQARSVETVNKLNEKWAGRQQLLAPVLRVPYSTAEADKGKKPYPSANTLYITPKYLEINAALTPVTRSYGIFKAILYKSEIRFEGYFTGLADFKNNHSECDFGKAQIAFGVTDLKGMTQNPEFNVDGKRLETTVGSLAHFQSMSKTLLVNLNGIELTDSLRFDGVMRLNGSGYMSFIPVGQHTSVTVGGEWPSPSFIGGFSPESTVDKKGFSASWDILGFNREIPERWSDNNFSGLDGSYLGVNLIETVDSYQQNMRSAKYALMFIALTFTAFFFVEVFTKKTIMVFQYALVGIALILFYSLLLSLSEHIGFGWAYLAASVATILLITAYFYTLIRQTLSTAILMGVLLMLYAFLYILLRIEDFALLFGSIFLFVVLGVIMFVSNKIKIEKHGTDEAADGAAPPQI
jgi:inner membrane protein